jgi:hypothetical protein
MTIQKNKKIFIVYINNNFFYEKLFIDFLKKKPKISKIISIPSSQKINLSKIIYYLRFYKLKGFLYLVLLNILYKIKSKIKKICKEQKIDYLEIKSFKILKKTILITENIDLIISTVDIKIDEQLLKKPKDGWVNVHCGDLRKYRGVNSPFWTMLNDEKELTMSIHLMREKFDDGPLIIEKKIKNEKLPFFLTIKKLFSLASDDLYNMCENYSLVTSAQLIDNNNSKYFSEPKIKDSEIFLKKGLKYI